MKRWHPPSSVTLALHALAAFARDRRVIVTIYHKSTLGLYGGVGAASLVGGQ